MRKAVIDYTRCRNCLRCIGSCPRGAIVFSAGRVVIDSQRCTGCGSCLRACPFGTISLTAEEKEVGSSLLKNQVVSLKQKAESLIKRIEMLKAKL